MPDPGSANTIRFTYSFQLPAGGERLFDVYLDADTLELVPAKGMPKPPWTKLKYFQCANCPLGNDIEECPVAVSLATLVETFKDAISFENTTVRVTTEERAYEKATTLQKGLSSIIGIYMVTSNCPVMDQLRPMVRFHLPFASMDETIYRAVAMYLVAQHFIAREGGKADFALEDLGRVYRGVHAVNRGMASRLRAATRQDAIVNAIVLLDVYSSLVPAAIHDILAEIKPAFAALLNESTPPSA